VRPPVFSGMTCSDSVYSVRCTRRGLSCWEDFHLLQNQAQEIRKSNCVRKIQLPASGRPQFAPNVPICIRQAVLVPTVVVSGWTVEVGVFVLKSLR